eukprot:ANDGO_05041.mRNA.1 Peroxisomal targeting signal 2 receptor
MPFYRTGYHGYAVEFSPFEENRIAVAAAQHFGIVGNGRQFVLEFDPKSTNQPMDCIAQFDTQDGCYDCAWSEENENQLVSVCGDGSMKLWDITSAENPLKSLEEHKQEVYSVDWNLVGKDTIVTGSWDDTVKVWSVFADESLRTFDEHKYCVYATIWSPHDNDRFVSASGDFSVKIWDVNAVNSVLSFEAHKYEVLTVDWNKYNEHIVATGSVDRTIRVWDLRSTDEPLYTLTGHSYAVRRVKFSPHDENILASASYDMSMCIWDISQSDPLLQKYEHHSEFVVGVDFSLHDPELLATASWDECACVWKQGEQPVLPSDGDSSSTQNLSDLGGADRPSLIAGKRS